MTDPIKPTNSGPLGTRMRVLSWNLWWQFGPWQARAAAIEAALLAADADAIALQEVWGDADKNFAAILADKLEYHHFHADCMRMNGVGFHEFRDFADLHLPDMALFIAPIQVGAEEIKRASGAVYAGIERVAGLAGFICAR